MARVLIVGCGCRGRELAAALAADGHSVRGTSRTERGFAAIGAAGAEPVLADPAVLSSLLPHLGGISVLCWLLGSVTGEVETVAGLHGERLESLAEHLVDTHVRGLVYEGAGAVDRHLLERGAAIVRRAGQRHSMPVAVIDEDPADHSAWRGAGKEAVERVLSA